MKEMVYQKDEIMQVLYDNQYKGYKYYIISYGLYPCAYIEIPKGHKLYGAENYHEINVFVHGGLTYSKSYLYAIGKEKSWFIGWDYCHAGDYAGFYEDAPFNTFKSIEHDKKWTTEEINQECKLCIEQIIMNYS